MIIKVIEIAKKIKPSSRGELGIVNQEYLRQGLLSVKILGRGFTWLDKDFRKFIQRRPQFISTVQDRQGLIIACLEEIAFNDLDYNRVLD